MKKNCIRFFILLFVIANNFEKSYAQIGIGTNDPENSSKLDVYSLNKGFLPPRMTEAQRDVINGGDIAEGLVIYNTDENCLNFYNGTTWISLCNNGDGGTPPSLPGNITLTAGQKTYIASVYDEDYLPYTTATAVAATGSIDADGTTETLVDIQGTLNTTTGLIVQIPYTVITAPVTLPAFSQTKTVISDYIQGSTSASNDGGGTAVDVIFSYDEVTLGVGSGVVTATIKAVSSDLNAVKLDINSGIGTDIGLLLAEFTIATDASGGTGTVQLKDIPGIPDRRFGETTTLATTETGQFHNNIYLPVLADDGKVWLNNNLGANYSDITHSEFNLAQQAQAKNGSTVDRDQDAYGSLFQWGRNPDGHELVNWSSSTSGTPEVVTNSSTPSTVITPNTSIFYLGTNNQSTYNQNWVDFGSSPNTIEDGLWQGESGPNNPCPHGFRIPKHSEIVDLFNAEPITNSTSAATSNLALTRAGFRFYGSGAILNTGSDGYIWSSDIAGFLSKNRRFNLNNGINDFDVQRANAYSIRCIQHVETPLPTNITLTADKTVWVPSVYDNDYLPYGGQPVTAGFGTVNPTGTVGNETLINHQGTITTSGKTVKIPYTVSGGTADLAAFSQTQTVPSTLIQGSDALSTDGGGATVDLILEYGAQTGLSGSGTITATIKAVGSTMNARKLDINNGIGQDLLGHLLAQFTLVLDNAGTTGNVDVRSIAGIPDRNFGQTIPTNADDNYGGLNEYHNSLYLPVTGLDNQVWLNNNLGANYSNIDHADFNIATQAQTTHDVNAVGYLYQWGRKLDGHEIFGFIEGGTNDDNVEWSDRLSKNEDKQHADPHATNGKFAVFNASQSGTPSFPLQTNHWTSDTSTDLWKGEDAQNNPCPEGFRIPTMQEIDNFNTANSIGNSTDIFNSYLKMPIYAGTATNGTINVFSGTNFPYNKVHLVSSETDPWTHNNNSYLEWNSKGYEYNSLGVISGNRIEKNTGYSIRCIQHVEAPAQVPANMTLTGNKVAYIASISDNDYLPYTTPTGPAGTATLAADGSNETNNINVQGTLTTIGQTISIPYSVSSGSVTYDAYSYTVIVPANLTEDGVSREVNFSYPSATVNGSGNITMTVKSIGGDLNLKKLDLNNGLGNGTSIDGNIANNIYGVLIAEVPIYINSSEDIEYVQLRDISGIPDRMFGEASADGDVDEHDFLYLPVQAEDGNVWLNNNLGANYSNIHKSGIFNPVQVAQSYNDYHAYGSMFQQTRKPDGHELINWTSQSSGSPINGVSGINAKVTPDVANHSLYIRPQGDSHGFNHGWFYPAPAANDHGWSGVNGRNNPCPEGFRLPSQNELYSYFSSQGMYLFTEGVSSNSMLKFPSAGVRAYAGTLHFSGTSISNGNGSTPYATGDDLSFFGSAPSLQVNLPDVRLVHNATHGDQRKFNNLGSGTVIRCIQHVEKPAPVPSNITLSGNKVSYIASISDNDYVPYTIPAGPADTAILAADGSNETNNIDVQGTLTTSGQTILIPYSVSSGSVNYDAYDYTVTVPANLTEDGISRQVNFSYPSATVSGSGNITMTVKSVGGDLNLKKLDINNGLGDGTSTDGNIASGVYGVLIAEVPIYVNSTNSIEYIQLRDVSGIPDRRFGDQTNQGGSLGYYHNNLYLPVVTTSGRTWLNHNLGADYSDLTHPNFNIGKRPTSENDFNAYGSSYQGGRFSDGHELIVYSGAHTGSPVNSPVTGTTGSNTPNSNYFFVINTHNHRSDWRTPQNYALWQGVNGINNPCPLGFRLPTETEMNVFKNTEVVHSSIDAFNTTLALTETGYRIRQSGYFRTDLNSRPGDFCFYWTSSRQNVSGGGFFGRGQQFYPNGTSIPSLNGVENGYGVTIRCIQD